MSAQTRVAFAAAVRREPVDLGRACLLLAAEAGASVLEAAYEQTLSGLVARCAPPLANGAEPAEALRVGLGEGAGFAGSAADYADLRSSLLPEVLTRRRGLPILLSVVWMEVAARLGVAAAGVGLPGHFVVSVQGTVVDPFAGGRLLSRAGVAERVRAATGGPLLPEHLLPWEPVDILLRILTNVRALAARSGRTRTQLWAVDLSLLLPRHPAALRRERGELLGRSGDFLGAAGELTAYADAVGGADPAAAESARQAARSARSRLN